MSRKREKRETEIGRQVSLVRRGSVAIGSAPRLGEEGGGRGVSGGGPRLYFSLDKATLAAYLVAWQAWVPLARWVVLLVPGPLAHSHFVGTKYIRDQLHSKPIELVCVLITTFSARRYSIQWPLLLN